MNQTDPLLLLTVQITLSVVTFGLAAQRLARPLAAMPRERALALLLWLHAFRYVPLGLLAPGQVAREIPPLVLRTIAIGDLASAVLALVALAALEVRAKAALGWVWLFSLVSVLDIGTALIVGLGNHVYRYALGISWYVLTLYVPLVCLSQAMLLIRLLQKRSTSATNASGFVHEGPA
jgi:hypothetical protein